MLSFSWIVYLGGAITCFTIIHHVIIILKTLFENSNLPQQYNCLKVFATLIFVANLLWNVINLPVGFIQFDHYIFGCRFFFGVIMVIYYIGKCCIWVYNIIRLEFIFHGIPLGYDQKFLNKLKVMFVVSAILLAAVCILGMVPFQNSDGLCVLDFQLWANASIMMPDAIMSCLCYWLFHRKMKMLTDLYNLNQNQSDTEAEHRDYCEDDKVSTQFLYVLRKFTILCAVTIISTWIAGTIAIIFADWSMIMGSVDSIVNVWCILMYDKRYDDIYVRVFGCIAKPEWNKAEKHRAKRDVSTPGTHGSVPTIKDNASNPTLTKSCASSQDAKDPTASNLFEMVIR
eukprot:62339_1